MGFANAIIGGAAALVRAAIKSPNYAAGTTGWSINKDGSAELNNATVRGTLTAATVIGALIESAASGRRTTIDASGDIKVYNASGAVLMWFVNAANAQYFYADTGTAAQGALIASSTPAAAADPFGNAALAGNTAYGTDGTNFYAVAVQGFAGKGPGVVFYTAGSLAGPWTQGPALYAGAAGALRELSAGNAQDQVLLRGSTDSVARANANQTAFTTVTATYTIQAGEAQLVSIYELHFAGNGQWNATTGQTLTFTLLMDGATQLGTFTIGAAGGIPAGAHYAVEGRYRIAVVTAGAGGTMNITGSAYLSDTDGNRQSAQSVLGNTNVTGKAINTTAAHSFAVQCSWGGAGTSQVITITDSDWTKKGN